MNILIIYLMDVICSSGQTWSNEACFILYLLNLNYNCLVMLFYLDTQKYFCYLIVYLK